MNANELADLLEVDSWYKLVSREEIATMLRQQQAKIEAFEKFITDNTERTEDTKEMNNEPVAWMFEGAFDISTYVSFEKPNPDIYPNPTPLYTHPAKTLTDDPLVNFKPIWQEKPELTLTDEEIKDFTVKIYNCRTGAEAHEIVLAILRKAQEK